MANTGTYFAIQNQLTDQDQLRLREMKKILYVIIYFTVIQKPSQVF